MELTSTEAVSLRRPLKERVKRNFQRVWASAYMRYGAAILITLSLVALFADVLATHEATRLYPAERLQTPSLAHFFGTDNLGRDVYSQTLAGARLSLFIGATVVAISIPIGTAIGMISGYNRRADAVIMRVVDGLSAFPSLVFALALMAALGASVVNVIIALTVTYLPRTARIARGSTLAVRELMYIDAERAIGSSALRIMRFHILPNIMAPILVLASFTFATAILVEAGLSFLGAGVGADVPSLGTHDLGRAGDHQQPRLPDGVPGRSHRHNRAGPEPAGRRPARRAGPAAARPVPGRRGLGRVFRRQIRLDALEQGNDGSSVVERRANL